MSTEARRTLVVDLELLESSRDLFREMAKSANDPEKLQEQAALVDRIIQQGTAVPLDHLTVVELATPVRETPWQRREREQFYSEADSTDADWAPAGGAA